MNELEVRELFVLGALIDSRLPERDRPARLKSQSLPFVHDFEDRRGWDPADIAAGLVVQKNVHGRKVDLSEGERKRLKRTLEDRLEYGDRGRHDIEAANFWDGDRITPQQVTEWEKCNELIRFVKRERNRRCLWAYAQAQAKVLRIAKPVLTIRNQQETHNNKIQPTFEMETVLARVSFSKWCHQIEGVHRNYGKTCADTAIAEITLALASKTMQPNGNGKNSTLQHEAQIRDIRVNLADQAQGHQLFGADNQWPVRDKAKALLRFDESLMHIDLSDLKRRERRRREAA